MKEQLLFLKNLVSKIKEINLNLDTLLREYEIKNRELEELKELKNKILDLSKKRKKLKFGLFVSFYNLIFFVLILSLIVISHLIYLPFFISILITTVLLIPLISSIEGIFVVNPRKIKNKINLLEIEMKEISNENELRKIKQKALTLEKELELKKKEIIKIVESNPILLTIFSKNNHSFNLETSKNIEKQKCYKS